MDIDALHTELEQLKEEHDTAMEVVGVMDVTIKSDLENETIQQMPFDRIRTLLDKPIGEPIDIVVTFTNTDRFCFLTTQNCAVLRKQLELDSWWLFLFKLHRDA